MKTLIKAIAVVAVYATIQGCTMGVGSPEYGCSGIPDGVKCASAKDLYHATNGGNVPSPMKKQNDDTEAVNDGEKPAIAGNGELQDQYNDLVTKRYVEANLPYQPIPIRTPSQTMRIFIAPYEDVEGDLLVPGLVYTDVEERRWVIGDQQAASKTTSFKLTKPNR